MKTVRDALGTAVNESGRALHKMRTDALDTVKNEFGHAKHENDTQYHRKQVWERKI
jgi:hypothetical protein